MARESIRVTGRDERHLDNNVELAKALDVVIAHCDGRQAGLIDWAMDNGYPEFDTVLRFGET